MTTVVVGLLATVLIILSPVITEGQAFLKALPEQVDRLQGVHKDNPQLYERLRQAAENATGGSSEAVTGNVKQVTFSIINFITDTLVVITVTIYFLLESKRIYCWTVRYLPSRCRRKFDRTIPEVSRVVSAGATFHRIYMTPRARRSARCSASMPIAARMASVSAPISGGAVSTAGPSWSAMKAATGCLRPFE
jgi:AI-2E family transporter